MSRTPGGGSQIRQVPASPALKRMNMARCMVCEQMDFFDQAFHCLRYHPQDLILFVEDRRMDIVVGSFLFACSEIKKVPFSVLRSLAEKSYGSLEALLLTCLRKTQVDLHLVLIIILSGVSEKEQQSLAIRAAAFFAMEGHYELKDDLAELLPESIWPFSRPLANGVLREIFPAKHSLRF